MFDEPLEPGAPALEIPSLVKLCQRVAANNAMSIPCFGDLRVDLLRPILGLAEGEDLMRWEEDSPDLQEHTGAAWRIVFRKKFPLEYQRMEDENRIPESWGQVYLSLKEQDKRRFEEARNKLRSAREEEEDRKRGRMTKVTAKPLPLKRKFAQPGPPKTLLQKARTTASKQQQATFTRMLPPAFSSKSYAPIIKKPDILPGPSASTSSHVSVTTVMHPRPPSTPLASSSSSAPSSRSSSSSSVGPNARAPPARHSSSAETIVRISEPKPTLARGSNPRPTLPLPAPRPSSQAPPVKISAVDRLSKLPASSSPAPNNRCRPPSGPPAPYEAVPTPDKSPFMAKVSLSCPPPQPPVGPPPAKRIKRAKDPMACLFMPKTRAISQIRASGK
ncbi:hypothetical protein BD626DRAFT_487602 [Schizophyllum amplum]|uniref:RNA polymerase II transcription factor SIII subunit A-domain-containing protein n=1 Tax=Schizophyllum amplum TaxID=97359 RepID=A0A550CNP9_9AGAR|nr:hypothetical protein BD626DRAFT_487602 [Auriculariopsis ampla]